MKAMVAARLLMGHFDSWAAFDQERQIAAKIANRQAARSVSAQIGRTYRDLSVETQKFIAENFARCDYADLAKLCDAISVSAGLYLRLDEFETKFFPLAERITRRFPFHAHVSITLWGLQFEFPEFHFLRDLESALKDLEETQARLSKFRQSHRNPKEARGEVADLIARERFLSRSIISAAFSLVEAFLSGLFFAAVRRGSIGSLSCDTKFVSYAKTKESAPLKHRIDEVVKFTSQGQSTGAAEPFKSLMEFGKQYRDAIHHTTPFERNAGNRLLDLYNINHIVALKIAVLCCDTILAISNWTFGTADSTVVGEECGKLRQDANRLFDLVNSRP
jgi:hypothetical protein